ncbi:transport permease protein [Azorhizobium oxalatiphilum]|uniref:Transport permease protein n=1 Tax=Azorhizobium oxalatiphilum TaxID=980631 RepID=A0A917CA13_9HYPH|nr:ABC transporter permease [Azorhizobium oxalatiphilum]GGF80215.1 transport permease protein [Azorhizobium oxalatiphilum]
MRLLDRALRFAELPPVEGRRSFPEALKVQLRVQVALMLRGALSRYGHENLGFFWIMGEPLLMTVSVMIMWSMAGMDHGHGIGLVPFVLTGYTMLTTWRHIVMHMGHAIAQNAGLMFHRNVRMVDILSGQVVLEVLGGLAAFFIAYIPLYLADVIPAIHDPLLLISGWFFIAWLGFGFGMCIAGLAELSEAVGRFIPPMMYITIPATGAFYMLSWMPEKAQKVLAWSPLVAPFEMFRGGLFGPSVHAQFDIGYMLIVCTLNMALGLALVRAAAKRVHLS